MAAWMYKEKFFWFIRYYLPHLLGSLFGPMMYLLGILACFGFEVRSIALLICLFMFFLCCFMKGKPYDERFLTKKLQDIETKYEQAQKVAGLVTIAEEQDIGTLQIADVGNLGVVENK